MNIELITIDDLNAQIELKLAKEDYTNQVNEVLKDYKKKVNMPGFRPGNVPMGMVKKMYGKAVLADEINKIVGQKLSGFIQEKELAILGEPMMNNDKSVVPNFDFDLDYTFTFDIGYSPKLDFAIDKEIKIPFYKITITDEMVKESVDAYCQKFGNLEETDIAETLEEVLEGDLQELNDKGEVLEGGVQKEAAKISLKAFKDDEIKNQFKGVNKNQIINFDLKKALPNDTELATLLGVEKEQLAETGANFQFTVFKIEQFKNAEVGQELFDKAFGEGNIKSEEEFNAKIKEEIGRQLDYASSDKFNLDAQKYFMDNIEIALPEAFLQKWLTSKMKADEEKNYSDETIATEFEKAIPAWKWMVLQQHINKLGKVEVSNEEIKEGAKNMIINQYMQYGIPMEMITDDFIGGQIDTLLKNEQQRNQIVDNLYLTKMFTFVKDNVTLDVKELSSDEFRAMVAPPKEEEKEGQAEEKTEEKAEEKESPENKSE